MKEQKFDVIIIGSGIAGLSTLLYLTQKIDFQDRKISICLIAKSSLNKTNTNWAQGGIAAVHKITDNFEKHIQDTILAGAYCNSREIVNKVVTQAPELINDLVKWGTIFDKTPSNEYDLAKEGGHSEARIWHKEDQTGKAIQNALIQAVKIFENITIYENTQCINIVKLENQGYGLLAFERQSDSFINLYCSQLVLATGGLGMLYASTTNQSIATGEGIYFANQLGAIIKDLSFIQFHPTGLFQGEQITYLITEAIRGAGALLRNEKGEVFMYKYDSRLELAPRDIVSRAILKEISLQEKPFVYLDATGIDESFINSHFPNIKMECEKRLGLKIDTDWIPIIPVQHYSCGGVKVDEYGETNLKGLFVIGESASTGLHGANRLASNSLLEAIAFAKFAVEKIMQQIQPNLVATVPVKIPAIKKISRIEVQTIMSNYAGIVKSKEGLIHASIELNKLDSNALELDVFNCYDFESYVILKNALLLIEDAIQQKKNLGVFYNTDLV